LQIIDEFVIETIQRDDFAHFSIVETTVSSIEKLIELPVVMYIEEVYPDPEPENYTGRTLHRSNYIASDYSAGRHYDGTGVSIMLQDDGVIGPHIDYEGRIGQQFLSYNYGDHGDHVAGTIMGAGNLDPEAKGMAYGATLYVYGAAPEYPGFNLIPFHYNDFQIRISSTSYSNGCNAGYTSLARTMDQQIRLYPSLMHVFSAGNAGPENCDYGAGPGWGNVTGGHKIGKNVIAVANVNLVDNLSSSSSRGPAHDGRIKPDISAKGSSVYSTTNPNDYTLKSGTSMSCPGVSGTLGQLYHAYRDLNEGSDPTGGLMKAILLNTADDLGNEGPDFKYGYGRMNARRAVNCLENYSYDSAKISNGEVNNHEFTIPANLTEFRVMIYWTDYEAAASVSKALVNDLDMIISDPESNQLYPYILDPTPDPDSLDKPATRGPDHLNNMEQIVIDNPLGGTYLIEISGFEVPQSDQTYYLVYTMIDEEIIITYPIGGESFVPGGDEFIRWDASESDDVFTMEYTTDGGENWILISDEVSASRRYLEWDVPSTISGNAYIRIGKGDIQSMNAYPFSILNTPQNLSVEWSCEDSFYIQWDEVFGATGYEVSLLGEKYMDMVGYTSGNYFIIDSVGFMNDEWFSVTALGPNDARSKRAFARERPAGISNCHEQDVKMEEITLADWGYYPDCLDLDIMPVEIYFRNFGSESISDVIVRYQLNDGEIVSEDFSGSVDPGSKVQYVFENTINASEIGNYLIKVWVSLSEDTNPENDTLLGTFEVIQGEPLIAPFSQNFDSFEDCLTYPTCEAVICDLSENWINAMNQMIDDIDWRTYHGNTLTNNTGPDFDHTTGTDEGKYIYLEPSVACFNREARLMSPCIDLTDAMEPVLHFWTHAFGDNIGRLHVDALVDNVIHKNIIPPLVGERGDEWIETTINLGDFVGQKIALRFRGFTSDGQKGDLALDDISLTDLVSVDELNYSSGIISCNVYPNPGNGIFNIDVNNPSEEAFEIRVNDIYGRLIYQEYISETSSKQKHIIDLSNIAKGVYILTIKSDTGKSIIAITKQ